MAATSGRVSHGMNIARMAALAREEEVADALRAEMRRRIAPFQKELQAKGEVMALDSVPCAPAYHIDLFVPCSLSDEFGNPTCGAMLRAVGYHVFVDPDGRLLLFAGGICPKCATRREAIFDLRSGDEAAAKQSREMRDLAESLVAELADPPQAITATVSHERLSA
jgi:hypothetical protein